MTGTTFRINGDATRAEFLSGWAAIVQFLARKWAREPDYRLIKEPVKWEFAPSVAYLGDRPVLCFGLLEIAGLVANRFRVDPQISDRRNSRLSGELCS